MCLVSISVTTSAANTDPRQEPQNLKPPLCAGACGCIALADSVQLDTGWSWIAETCLVTDLMSIFFTVRFKVTGQHMQLTVNRKAEDGCSYEG